ncbi:MAG: nicotinamide-nucleotide amidohydrolase family protein [Bacilli bacterium]|nr:nicotinamide-nucleotide amidohydrolase family protein [Bacilli bacterium]
MYAKIVSKLDDLKRTIATMESCTGGALASEITNNVGASEVLKFSAVTYSNEYKIKMGVSAEVIDRYSVYSMETAVEMAKNISNFAGADYGVGITGKINTSDPANRHGEDDIVYVAIYDKQTGDYTKTTIQVPHDKTRKEVKEYIVEYIGNILLELLEDAKLA